MSDRGGSPYDFPFVLHPGMQCATVAGPGTPDWPLRIAEEHHALLKLREYLNAVEHNEWFTLEPTSEDATRWTGAVHRGERSWDLELALKDSYPEVPPACRIPGLMHYSDRKLDDPVLGLRLCDMHMEANYWWDAHSSIALYLRREVSFWVASVLHEMERKGWL